MYPLGVIVVRGIEADEIPGFDVERPRIVGRAHRLIQPDLDRGLISLQFAELSPVDVSRSLCRHDGAGDLCAFHRPAWTVQYSPSIVAQS